MTAKHKIFITVSALLLTAFFIYVIRSNYGYAHLKRFRQEHRQLIQKNEQIEQENDAFRIEIHRLKHDLVYIESIARHELGMIKKDEIILKPRSAAGRKK